MQQQPEPKCNDGRRNSQKKHDARATSLICSFNLLFFCRSCCHRRCRYLSSPMARAKCVKKLQNHVSRGKFYSKNRPFTLTTGSSIFFRTEFRSHWYNSGGPLLTLSFTNVAKANIPQNFFLEKMNSKRFHMKVLSQRVFISII